MVQGRAAAARDAEVGRVSRALWTALALAGAVLVETALAHLVSSPGRFLDPFLLVVVYCALSGGETHGMLAGAAAGWVQDVHVRRARARAVGALQAGGGLRRSASRAAAS